MKRLILPVFAIIFSISIPVFSVLVENPPTAAGSGSGDVIGPASNTDLYVPQWDGTDSKTLKNGFAITTQGKALVAKTSTADMVTYLGAGSGLSGTTGYLPKFTSSSQIGNSVMYENTNKIGINTTGPDKALEINSATGANMRLTYNDSDGSAANYADFSTNSGGDLTIAPSLGSVIFTPPSNQVVEVIANNGSISTRPDCGFVVIDPRSMAADVGGGISFQFKYNTGGDYTGGGCIRIGKENSTSGQYGTYMAMHTRVNGSTNYTERLRITSAGSVGIGTTTPQRTLSVSGNAQVTGNAYITGLLSGATGTFSGTVTANALSGTLPATNLSGTVASARISGSYSGITQTGTLATLNVSGTLNATLVLGDYQSITIGVDGGGTTPATGALSATYHAPINITLTDYYMSADVTGSAVIDIKRNGTSIVGGSGNKPTLSSNVKSTAALASWTSTTITAGDRLTFNLDSCTTCTAVTVILKGRRQ